MKTNVVILSLMFLLFPGQLFAQTQLDSLRGLSGVQVVVEDVSDDFRREVITRELLVANTELRLRREGIRVYDRESEVDSVLRVREGDGYLYLRVTSVRRGTAWAFHVKLEFRQDVKLERDLEVSLGAPTWHNGSIVITGEQMARGEIWDQVDGHLSLFINEFLAANPPVQ